MTVKDIVKKTATLLGREDVVEYLESEQPSGTEDTLSAVNVMVRLLNMVISELSASFIPMVAVEDVELTTMLSYDKLQKNVVEIVKVFDKNEDEIPFKVYYDHISTSFPIKKVEYKFHPQTYALNDQIDYKEKDIPATVLCFGLSAEFALSEGDFERACSLHERYVDGVRAICKPKNLKIRERSWE